MPVRTDLASRIKVIASANQSITDATTTSFDFGTPNDIDLRAATNYNPGDRVLVVATFNSDGTTDTTSLVIQDADDNAGSIGTPATADTDGTLTGATGDHVIVASVNVQPNRPWLRIRVTESGATDTVNCYCTVLAVPQALV